MRRALQEALWDTDGLNVVREQVHGVLKSADQIAELRREMDGVLKELNLQFQRIAQIQVQLDKLMSILSSAPKPVSADGDPA